MWGSLLKVNIKLHVLVCFFNNGGINDMAQDLPHNKKKKDLLVYVWITALVLSQLGKM